MVEREEKMVTKMILPSRSAVALWHQEISGQISDGMWENASPRNHWKFWCNMDVEFGPEAIIMGSPGYCPKSAYALDRLHQCKLGDGTDVRRERRLATGRMAKAGGDCNNRNVLRAAEYMPKTIEEWAYQAAHGWKYEWVAKYMDNITLEFAEKYYATTYTMKELRADLHLIQDTMKLVSKY